MVKKAFILIITIGALGWAILYMMNLSEKPLPGTDVGSNLEPTIVTPPASVAPPSISPTPVPVQPPSSIPTPSQIPPVPSSINFSSLTLSPSIQSAQVGQAFPVSIFLNTAGESVVAASVHVKFDASLLEVDRIESSDSILPIEAERIIGSGNVIVTRGKTTPGYNGVNGRISTIFFKGIKKGTGEISISYDKEKSGPSRIIADDGQGTNVLGNITEMNFEIL